MTAKTSALLDFLVATPCSLHDSQNAFRWGQLQEFQDRNLMRDFFVAVESLRSSSDLISTRVSDWVCKMLSPCPPRREAWINERRQLLEALGVEVETASVLVDDLQLCWEGGRLWVWDNALVVGR